MFLGRGEYFGFVYFCKNEQIKQEALYTNMAHFNLLIGVSIGLCTYVL